MDRLKSMAVFVQVVDKGGFVAAVNTTGISAAMVGNHIRFLESELGARLLSRTTRHQSLTEVGRMYYERCRSILEQIKQADSDARETVSLASGVLRVTAPVSFGVQCLAPALAQFLEKTPNVKVDLTLTDNMVELVNEGFDVAIRIGHLPSSGLVARPLVPYKMIICAAPGYIAKRGAPMTPDDLTAHDCIAFGFRRETREWTFLDNSGAARTVAVGGRLNINSGQGLRQAALAGAGIIMQPELLLADDIKTGALVRLLEHENMQARPMHIVYQRDARMPLKLRYFVDFISQMWGNDPAPRPRQAVRPHQA